MEITLLAAGWDGQPPTAWLLHEIQSLDSGVVAEQSPASQVLARVGASPPEVLLLAFESEQPERAWRLLAGIARLSPATRVIVLCEAYTPELILDFIRHRANGCLLRSDEPARFAKAVRSVHSGQTWFGRADLLGALRSQLGARPPDLHLDTRAEELLTAREREILTLIGSALSNKEIARQLQISTATVKTHLHRVYVKLHRSGRYKAFLADDTPPDRFAS